jgi:hypothetical protein
LTGQQLTTIYINCFEASCHFMGNERDAGADQLVAVSSLNIRIFFTFFFGVTV